MPDQTQTQTQTAAHVPAPMVPGATPAAGASATTPAQAQTKGDISEVAGRIDEAHNILIALSSDPTVDELCAAIGLSLCLDRAGKRATAIYSGETPNALEFLNPGNTFEKSADTLQDFVIALNKDKADHLRYKLDGDYVKIFITPYKTKIASDDLEFSYGDFNIDLVLALDVANGVDLDSALREHGRIMHDARIINITTGNPGKFGEVEWSDKKASSVSEMAAKLLYAMGKDVSIKKDDATALLTGIVAATDRFSNSHTSSETMQVAAKLMSSGANQQLVAENMVAEVDNELFNFMNSTKDGMAPLKVEHDDEKSEDESEDGAEAPAEDKPAEVKLEVPEVKAEVPEVKPAEVKLEMPKLDESKLEMPTTDDGGHEEKMISPSAVAGGTTLGAEPVAERVLEPSGDFLSESESGANKYGKMLEEALNEGSPKMEAPVSEMGASVNTPMGEANPAANVTPIVGAPEPSNVPDINYMPMPGDEVLPPPPVPPIDMNLNAGGMPPVSGNAGAGLPDVQGVPEIPMMPPVQNDTVPSTAPAATSAPATPDASAFRIPGM